MTTGYRAPTRTKVHRKKTTQLGSMIVEETWCGMKADFTRWIPLADTDPDCTRCINAWQRHVAEQLPFAVGEPVRYTEARHPGLMHFNQNWSGSAVIFWSWRVHGAPRTHWALTKDERAPAGRPFMLALGFATLDPVGYHTGVVEAVEWTKNLVLHEGLLPMYRALRAGLWDPQADHPLLGDTASGTPKETNPA